MVELLLTEGAEKNNKDRWGNTALQDAINHNQGPVIQLLVQWKSELNNDNAAGRLCDAASAGDIDTLKLILEHGVDPNCGDYDARTPLVYIHTYVYIHVCVYMYIYRERERECVCV